MRAREGWGTCHDRGRAGEASLSAAGEASLAATVRSGGAGEASLAATVGAGGASLVCWAGFAGEASLAAKVGAGGASLVCWAGFGEGDFDFENQTRFLSFAGEASRGPAAPLMQGRG